MTLEGAIRREHQLALPLPVFAERKLQALRARFQLALGVEPEQSPPAVIGQQRLHTLEQLLERVVAVEIYALLGLDIAEGQPRPDKIELVFKREHTGVALGLRAVGWVVLLMYIAQILRGRLDFVNCIRVLLVENAVGSAGQFKIQLVEPESLRKTDLAPVSLALT